MPDQPTEPAKTGTKPRKLVKMPGKEQIQEIEPPVVLARAKNADIAPTWTSPEIEQAKNALLRNLTATKRFFDKQTKSYIEVDDPMAQIAAATQIINQAVGMPVQRQVRVDAVFKDRQQELLEVASTPTGRAFLLHNGLISEEWLAAHLPDSQK